MLTIMGGQNKALWKEEMITITSQYGIFPTSGYMDKNWTHSTDITNGTVNRDIVYNKSNWINKAHL